MKYQSLFILLIGFFVNAQTDFTDQWQDLFSYNEVKDFTIVDDNLYAITDNAMFVYDIEQKITTKFSSVNGLSGNITSAVAYDNDRQNILIGYENGLLEIIENNNNVIPLTGLRDHLIILDKGIEGIVLQEDYAYIYGGFGISQLNIDDVEFKSTFALSDIGDNSVNDLLFEENMVYAATDNGLYGCSLTEDVTSFSNWNILASGIVSNVESVDNEVYFSISDKVYHIDAATSVLYTATNEILELGTGEGSELVVVLENQTYFLSIPDFFVSNQIIYSDDTGLSFSSSKGIVYDGSLYLNSEEYGVLTTPLGNDEVVYAEIHPDGPSANNVFSVRSVDGEKWVTYGGYVVNGTYNAFNNTQGIDFFDGENWQNYERSDLGSLRDYTSALTDPNDENRVLVSTYNTGVVELENGVYKQTWNHTNTDEVIPYHRSNSNINWEATLFLDKGNNIWAANARGFNNQLFSKFDSDLGEWIESVTYVFDSSINSGNNTGINKVFIDKNNNVFAGSTNQGLLIFNANDDGSTNKPTALLSSDETRGGLPSSEVLCAAVDDNNRVWIGTDLGLVVFDDYNNIYNTEVGLAETIIITEDGDAKELLTDIRINDVLISQSGTIWVATHTAGVFHISSDGQTTLNTFDTTNSPMPSDTVTDLEIDEVTGLLYIVTDLGVLEYDSKSEPFGESITEVVAYPNPAISTQANHDLIYIVAKNGEGLPVGTNIKIIDVSGKLVFEENISSDGSTTLGGSMVWDKRNLAGNYVVSGIYIVLVSNADGTQNTSTKIAIIN